MTELLFLLGAALMVWLGIGMIRGNPEAFSKDAMGRSFFVLGILALILIGVIAVCVKLLK